MEQVSRYNRKHFLSLCWVAPFLASFIPFNAISKQPNRTKKGRRVVTGINAEGNSIILRDGVVPKNAKHVEPGKIDWDVLWVEQQVPVDLSKSSDTLEGYALSLEPPQGGTTAHILTLEPGYIPDFHRTNTIDFVFIISGKLELQLEGTSTILSSGDSVIQRGTNHAWRVVGKEPCTIAAVMVSAMKS